MEYLEVDNPRRRKGGRKRRSPSSRIRYRTVYRTRRAKRRNPSVATIENPRRKRRHGFRRRSNPDVVGQLKGAASTALPVLLGVLASRGGRGLAAGKGAAAETFASALGGLVAANVMKGKSNLVLAGAVADIGLQFASTVLPVDIRRRFGLADDNLVPVYEAPQLVDDGSTQMNDDVDSFGYGNYEMGGGGALEDMGEYQLQPDTD